MAAAIIRENARESPCPVGQGYLGDFSELSLSRRGEIASMFSDDGEPLWEIVAERKFRGGYSGSYESPI